MRILKPGEVVEVKGADLIEGGPDDAHATIASVVEFYAHTSENASMFGFVLDEAWLANGGRQQHLPPHSYFAVHGDVELLCANAVVMVMHDYLCLPQLGGPVEKTGRLKYIDGCTDTVLIAPPVKGDPCLNLLHFPPHTDQTMHTHPSLRCGMTIAGRGIAKFPGGDVELTRGSCWFLSTGGEHAFHTQGEELLVTAWHPDSDTGPWHDDHPMLNKTMVDGISARQLDDIRTL